MSQHNTYPPDSSPWTSSEKFIFRFFFIYFLIQIIPIDCKFWKQFFSIHWLSPHFKEIFELTRYVPKIFSYTGFPESGIYAFADWFIFFVIAGAGTIIWTYYDKQRKEYNNLYYWFRVILRYRLAIAVIGYGFIKLFPLQAPYPSLSNLHTNYGDFFAWKIYLHTLGIAPNYESFLGFIEIAAGLLLFYRRTVTFGAGLILGFIGNVAFVNGSYEIGDLALSTFLVLISIALIAYDVPRLYRLLAQEKPTKANRFHLVLTEKWQQNTRTGLRAFFVLFVLFYGYKTYSSFRDDPYLIPKTAGLKGSYGYYNVRQFVANKDTLAYSLTNPRRWQDVVFEQWATLSIKSARPVKIDITNGDALQEKDIDRTYESAGVAGRHYYHYDADTVEQTLSLQNKNPNHRNEKIFLKYQWQNDSTLVLTGVDYNKDSIHVILDRINKKYMMFEGRRKPIKL